MTDIAVILLGISILMNYWIISGLLRRIKKLEDKHLTERLHQFGRNE